MSYLITKTPPVGAEQPPEAPTHDDGTPYSVMATYEGGWLQAWADHDEEIAAALIGPQYHQTDSPTERAQLRLQYLARAQVRAMALIANEDPRFAHLTIRQQDLWIGEWSGAVIVAEWDAELSLPLIRQWYSPIGLVPPPRGNITWLDAASDEQLLQSLSQLGAITLHRRATEKEVG